MLTERQSRILELVIGEYVERAAPVSSQLIARTYELGASPATVRHEMAELESEGYLTHPHTSSGRVPTDQGYRFFVETLMHEEELPWEVRQTIRHQFHQADRGQEAWVQLAASVLARVVENAAVVTTPRSSACHLKHLELVSLHDREALLVLVLDQARVRQQVLTLDEPCTQDELSSKASRLNHLFAGKTVDEIAADGDALTPVERQVLDVVTSTMRAVDAGRFDEAHLEGLRHVLRQPEFADSERALGLLEALDEHNLSRLIPIGALAQPGVTVVIGAVHTGPGPEGEVLRLHTGEALRECSVVIGGYGAPGAASGALAVLGPMRMRYSRTISTVRYLSDVMSELLSERYG